MLHSTTSMSQLVSNTLSGILLTDQIDVDVCRMCYTMWQMTVKAKAVATSATR